MRIWRLRSGQRCGAIGRPKVQVISCRFLEPGGRGLDQTLISSTIVTDDAWHRVGLVWDGAERRIYVDGVVVAADIRSAGLQDSPNGLNIGCGKNLEPGTFWSGLIDDVRIYSEAIEP